PSSSTRRWPGCTSTRSASSSPSCPPSRRPTWACRSRVPTSPTTTATRPTRRTRATPGAGDGMARTALPAHDVADLTLAPDGELRIDWAAGQMPVLAQIQARFAAERPLEGIRVAACLHVTAETANLVRTLAAGGATVALCSANPLSAQDDVAAALVLEDHVEVRARRGEDVDTYVAHVLALLDTSDGPGPQITLDGGAEETTTGLVRLRRLQEEGTLRCPVLAVNEARTERALNDRHGTGQSALDGIVRASNVLLAGHTVVVVGYGWAGQGI